MLKTSFQHKICILTKDEKELILISETYPRKKYIRQLSDKIITQYQYIGYENDKNSIPIFDNIIDIFANIIYKILSYKPLNDTFSLKDINSYHDMGKTIIDLGEKDKLSIYESIVKYFIDIGDFIISLSGLLVSFFVKKDCIKGNHTLVSIVWLILLYRVIGNYIVRNTNYSYESKIKLSHIFGTIYFKFRRAKIIADTINDFLNLDNKNKKMLAIIKPDHWQGVIYHLINHKFFPSHEMTLEDYFLYSENNSTTIIYQKDKLDE